MQKELIKFLKSKRRFSEYKREFNKYRGGDLSLFFEITPPIDWIISAFTWDETSAGYYFWESINNKWTEIINDLK